MRSALAYASIYEYAEPSTSSWLSARLSVWRKGQKPRVGGVVRRLPLRYSCLRSGALYIYRSMRIQEYEEAVAVEVQLPEERCAIYHRSIRTYMREEWACQWPSRLLLVKQGRLNISISVYLHV